MAAAPWTPTVPRRWRCHAAPAALSFLLASLWPVAQSAASLGGGPPAQPTQDAQTVKLPDVGAVLSKASDKIQELGKHTENMYKRVAEQQQENKALLKLRREQLEMNLTQQARRNEVLKKQHKANHVHLEDVKAANDIRRERVDELQRRVDLMRTTTEALHGKLGMATEFIDESLKVADASAAEELSVLQPPKPRPSLKRLLAATGPAAMQAPAPQQPQQQQQQQARPQGKPLTLFQVDQDLASAVRDVIPIPVEGQPLESYVQALQNGLDQMRDDHRRDLSQLTAKYVALLAPGEQEYIDLQEAEARIRSELETQDKMTEKLEAASTKLTQVHGDLTQRLKGLAFFAQQLKETTSKTISLVNPASRAAREPEERGEGAGQPAGARLASSRGAAAAAEAGEAEAVRSKRHQRHNVSGLLQEEAAGTEGSKERGAKAKEAVRPPLRWFPWR